MEMLSIHLKTDDFISAGPRFLGGNVLTEAELEKRRWLGLKTLQSAFGGGLREFENSLYATSVSDSPYDIGTRALRLAAAICQSSEFVEKWLASKDLEGARDGRESLRNEFLQLRTVLEDYQHWIEAVSHDLDRVTRRISAGAD